MKKTATRQFSLATVTRPVLLKADPVLAPARRGAVSVATLPASTAHVLKKLSAAGVEIPAKADCEPKRFVRELRGPVGDIEVGHEIKVDALEGVTAVDITGTSKGRGFAGVMKRHNFAGQRASHGVKKCHRHPGGTGMSASPSRLFKGKRMAGQYGNERVTTRNLKLYKIDSDNNLLLIKGAVPGPTAGCS